MPYHRARLEDLLLTRRELLARMGSGFAALGLAGVMGAEGLLASPAEAASRSAASLNPLAPRSPHFPVKAKRVIFLFMNGGPSHVDTFDPKPELVKYAGQPLPERVRNGMSRRDTTPLLGSPFKMHRYGQSGTLATEIYPEIGSV